MGSEGTGSDFRETGSDTFETGSDIFMTGMTFMGLEVSLV